MTFRFVHTGDLHLDSPLTDLRGLEDARADAIADAPRRAFARLVDRAIEDRVDAVLIAGDLWDGDWRDVSAGLFVAAEVRRLSVAGIRTIAILGNHDAASKLTRQIHTIDGLTILSAAAPESLAVGPAVVHGQSFAEPATLANLARAYPAATEGRINVGLLHTALDGTEGHAPYAPCTLAELQAKRYDYWALAHVHGRRILAHEPAVAGGTVAYCGVLQGRHARELGTKGALAVSIAAPGARAEVAPIDLPFVAWHRVDADVTGLAADDARARAVRAALDGLRTELPTDLEVCVIRLILTGETDRDAAWRAAARVLREEATLAAIASDPRFVVESVRVETCAPAERVAVRLPHHFERLLADAADDPEVVAAADGAIAEILAVLPAAARDALVANHPDLTSVIDRADLSSALHRAALGLAAKLEAP